MPDSTTTTIKMSACREMCNCGLLLNKVRILSKFKVHSQVELKRYVLRVPWNACTEDKTLEYHPSKPRSGPVPLARDSNEIVGDFFGIESEVGAKEITERSTVSPVETYAYLLRKKPADDEEPVVEEKVITTSFGSVRLDVDNQVKVHGQHDKIFEERLSIVQLEKYKLQKRQMIDKGYRNISESNIQDETVMNMDLTDIVESESTNTIDDQYSSHLSDHSELLRQKEKTGDVINMQYDEKHLCDATKHHTKRDAMNDAETDKSNYIDEQYFSQHENTNVEQNVKNSNDAKHSERSSVISDDKIHCVAKRDDKYSYIDEQYYSQVEKKDTDILKQRYENETSNFIEQQYFDKSVHDFYDKSNSDINGYLHSTATGPPETLLHSHIIASQQTAEPSCTVNVTNLPNKFEGKICEDENEVNQKSEYATCQDADKSTTQTGRKDNPNTHLCSFQAENCSTIENSNEKHYGYNTIQEKKQYVKPNIEHPQTAYDYVMKLRKEETQKSEGKSSTTAERNISLTKEKLDSKGFLILKTQVQNFKYLNQDTIVTALKNSILYNDNDIVVLSKPYGLVCKGGNTKLTGTDIETCLPDLGKRIFRKSLDSSLYLVHGLDKDTTGILVLARTEKMAHLLTDLFAKNQIKKIYWALTKGVPDVSEGIIDIPIAEGVLDQKRIMMLRPDDDACKPVAKPSRKAERAITHYNIISTKDSAALMEVKPETNLKHQVRAHLGFGLRCPILGDHKYSNLNKIAPQKLPDDMLRRLNIRQSKVRYVPMHLHLKTLIIPEILDGKNLFFHANLPYHFKTNLNKLKFRKT